MYLAIPVVARIISIKPPIIAKPSIRIDANAMPPFENSSSPISFFLLIFRPLTQICNQIANGMASRENINAISASSIIIDSIDTATLSDGKMTSFRRDKIGFIFQLFNLFPFLSAVENVETPLLLKGMKAGVAREQAKMILRELGMGGRLYHKPSELSGGQQQRIAVARALITEPAIILRDEPTGDLDSTTSADVMNLFRRINRINQQTLVLVTHNRWIAEKCDYIVHMSDGKVSNVEYGPFTTKEDA